MSQKLSQIRVVHLSDIHFGEKHRFRPPRTPSSDEPSRKGYPTLLESLQQDWKGQTSSAPVVVAITGDLVQTAHADEFAEAGVFLQEILQSPVFGRPVTKEHIFLVPGNHDICSPSRTWASGGSRTVASTKSSSERRSARVTPEC
jgi:3',5'-cyclic AMP phosphodiesterase CpdA